jgi:hypothetical protein
MNSMLKHRFFVSLVMAGAALVVDATRPDSGEAFEFKINPAIFTDGFIIRDGLQLAPPETCEAEGQKTFGIGTKKYVRGEIVGRAAIHEPGGGRDSVIEGKLRGCFANTCKDLARAGIDGKSGGGSKASLVLAGVPVYTQGLSGKGQKKFGPFIKEASIGGSIPLVPGVLDVSASTSIGAGAEFRVDYDIRAVPPLADIDGFAETFANGKGSIGVRILGGFVGSADLKGTMEFPSPSVEAELDTKVCQLGSSADVVVSAYELDLDASWRVGCVPFLGCVYSDSENFLHREGPKKTYPLF